MNTEQILKLIDAGFTKDEILQMQSGAALTPSPAAETSATPSPEATAADEETAKGEKPAEPFNGNQFIEQMQQTMNKFISDLQSVNLRSAQLPDTNTSAEDLLAKLINPPGIDKKKGE